MKRSSKTKRIVNKGEFMKTLVMVFAVLFGVTGCSIHTFNYKVDQPLSAGVGEKMLEWSDSKFFVVAGAGRGYEVQYAGRYKDELRLNYIESGSSSQGNGFFTHERPMPLTYDLSATNEISVKDVKIRVINADPSRIDFVILSAPKERDLTGKIKE